MTSKKEENVCVFLFKKNIMCIYIVLDVTMTEALIHYCSQIWLWNAYKQNVARKPLAAGVNVFL